MLPPPRHGRIGPGAGKDIFADALFFPGGSVELKAAVLIGHWGVERFTVLLCLLKVF